jgi:membrane protein DedA with SNARE-associated domain
MRVIEKEKPPFSMIMASILAAIIWAVLMLVYIVSWSSNFDWLQNLAIILLSLVVIGGIVGLMWVYWVYKRAS